MALQNSFHPKSTPMHHASQRRANCSKSRSFINIHKNDFRTVPRAPKGQRFFTIINHFLSLFLESNEPKERASARSFARSRRKRNYGFDYQELWWLDGEEELCGVLCCVAIDIELVFGFDLFTLPSTRLSSIIIFMIYVLTMEMRRDRASFTLSNLNHAQCRGRC